VFAFLVGLFGGWWIDSEIKKNRDFQRQLLERLPAPVEEEASNAADVTVEVDTAEADWANWYTHQKKR